MPNTPFIAHNHCLFLYWSKVKILFHIASQIKSALWRHPRGPYYLWRKRHSSIQLQIKIEWFHWELTLLLDFQISLSSSSLHFPNTLSVPSNSQCYLTPNLELSYEVWVQNNQPAYNLPNCCPSCLLIC